jgi:1-deoxy-D-xylulose-5-phosphate synthase
MLRDNSDVVILAVGSMVANCLKAAEMLKASGTNAAVCNCRFVKPLDEGLLAEITGRFSRIVTVEEGCLSGGFGCAVGDWLADRGRSGPRLQRLGIADRFIEHGDRSRLLESVGLHPEGIAGSICGSLSGEGRRLVTLRHLSPTPAEARADAVRTATKREE